MCVRQCNNKAKWSGVKWSSKAEADINKRRLNNRQGANCASRGHTYNISCYYSSGFRALSAVMADGVFKSRDIGLRAQKKILSRMATKNIAKTFIDGTTASLLDNLYRLCKMHTGNKVKAEKLIKNIIKIVIKIGVLHRNNQFNADELKDVEVFKRKFQNTQLSIISFYEVDYSFDLPYLQKSIAESRAALKSIVQRHLTDKSLNRIDEVFDFFSDASLLETAFKSDSPYREVLGKIVADINTAMETGDI